MQKRTRIILSILLAVIATAIHVIQTTEAAEKTKSDAVLIHSFTKELTGSNSGFGEINAGFGYHKHIPYIKGSAIIGIFENGFNKESYYVGVNWEEEIRNSELYFGIDIGGITGYELPLTPSIAPNIRYKFIRLNLVPIITRKSRMDTLFIGLSLYFEVK